MSINSSKQLAEKIHMFCNLLYHIDDYIKNKKERKDQLRVSKNIRLVLREVITSKINANYFINKEEFDSYKIKKENEEVIKIKKNYIKTINPLSFNQKNLNCINLFYNSNNEKYVINYLIIEKMFSIIQFCFKKIIIAKNIKLKKEFEKLNKNFVLFNTEEIENYESYINKNEDNNTNINKFHKNILNKILMYKNKPVLQDYYRNNSNNNINEIILNKYKNNNNYVNAFSIMTNSYKLNNIHSLLNYKDNLKKKSNDLKFQINKINNKKNRSLTRINNSGIFVKKTLKKNISLPIINTKKDGSNKNNAYSSKGNYKINETNYLLNNQIKKERNNGYNYNRILPLYNRAKIGCYK